MCLGLYLGTSLEPPLVATPDLTVKPVPPDCEVVRQWFSLPHVSFVGAHTGCSCGFPYIAAEEPIEYWEGMFEEGEDRQNDRRSLQALLDLIRPHVLGSGVVELYPVWNGEEALTPKGRIRRSLAPLTPEMFFFIERFVYELTSD